jgi:uncharacterized protein
MSRNPANSQFIPAWWIPGPHAQTLWAKLVRRHALPEGHLERWDTPDGDFVDIFRTCRRRSRPRLIVLHGLEGGLRSPYVRAILHRTVTVGWEADLLLFRGCGDEPNRTPRFYHSGETGDLAFVVRRLSAEDPSAPLFLVGYSLGGNVLLKWLAQERADLPSTLRGAVAISVPFDLEAGARHINHGLSRIYQWYFLRTLKIKARAKLAQFPGLFDAGALGRAHTMVEFDDAVTAPVHGFQGARDYYSRSSSAQLLCQIRIPTLLISAFDDPFLPAEVLQAAASTADHNPALQLRFSTHGGHVGFISGRIPGYAHYELEDYIMTFFAEHLS